jgi:hypothetical protein
VREALLDDEPRCTSYTLSGAECGSVADRAASHASSCHSYVEVVTTLAVAGGCSVALASGSALARQTPSAPRISNL